jgi:hypothetical protein
MVAFTGQASAPQRGAGDLASTLTGAFQASNGNAQTFINNAVTGAVSLLPGGAFAAPLVSGLIGLFAGKKTDEAKQSADINTIAAAYGISGDEAGTVVAYHANHSPDKFNDLAASVARPDGLRRFPELLAEYNGSNPPQLIQVGSLARGAQQTATAQQKMITTALTTSNFSDTATGQQFVLALQQLPGEQVVGTENMTVADILNKVLNGAVKGGSDAAADTAWGKQFKWSYIKDWLKENQLLAFFLAIIAGLGILTIVNIARGKHGKISI